MKLNDVLHVTHVFTLNADQSLRNLQKVNKFIGRAAMRRCDVCTNCVCVCESRAYVRINDFDCIDVLKFGVASTNMVDARTQRCLLFYNHKTDEFTIEVFMNVASMPKICDLFKNIFYFFLSLLEIIAFKVRFWDHGHCDESF